MAFFQEPPRLGNQFDDDPMLPSWIARFIGRDDVATELRALGDVAVEYYGKQLDDRENEPVLTQWDAWGNRIDKLEVSPLWREAQVLAARHGMVAAGYEATHGAHARTHQFAIVHVLSPSLDVYSCPLAMTDGAARTLLGSGNQAMIDRYYAAFPGVRQFLDATGGLWAQGKLCAQARASGPAVVLTLPCVLLTDADYFVRLYGVAPGTAPVPLHRYDFRVIRE